VSCPSKVVVRRHFSQAPWRACAPARVRAALAATAALLLCAETCSSALAWLSFRGQQHQATQILLQPREGYEHVESPSFEQTGPRSAEPALLCPVLVGAAEPASGFHVCNFADPPPSLFPL